MFTAQPSLTELKQHYREQIAASEQDEAAETQRMSREKGRTKNAKAKAALDEAWNTMKAAASAKRQRIYAEARQAIEAHPEEIANRKVTGETARRMQAEAAVTEAAQQAASDAEMRERIQQVGWDEARKAMESEHRQNAGVLLRTNEANRWKLESRQRVLEGNMAELERLRSR